MSTYRLQRRRLATGVQDLPPEAFQTRGHVGAEPSDLLARKVVTVSLEGGQHAVHLPTEAGVSVGRASGLGGLWRSSLFENLREGGQHLRLDLALALLTLAQLLPRPARGCAASA